MAKMVTRTVISTEAKAMVANLEAKTLEEKTLRIAGKFDDNDKLLRAIKKHVEPNVVSIVKAKSVETLYGVDENEFMKMAVELDAETRKPMAK